MTVSGKVLAVMDWILAAIPLILLVGIGVGDAPLAVLAIILWSGTFTYLGIRAWKSSYYNPRY